MSLVRGWLDMLARAPFHDPAGRGRRKTLMDQGLAGTPHSASPGKSSGSSPSGLKRVLGAFDLTLMGVGAILGAGIFAAIGTAAAGNAARPGAGPSLILSFVITAVVCGFTAVCYAELAACVPVSGSAYTYAYATLGELAAWVIGWDLILEYAISNVAIALSWGTYCRVLLGHMGLHVPWWLATDPISARATPELWATAPRVLDVPIVFNLLALSITVLLTGVVVWGIRESTRINTVMVLLKIAVLAFFIAMAASLVPVSQMRANLTPFFPNGAKGTFTGASIVFFAFVGYDSISTVAEETRNPGRNVPVGIIASLIICTVLYLAVTIMFCGMVPFDFIQSLVATEQADPLTMALHHVAPSVGWASLMVAAGAVIAQTSALLVYQIAQPRIFFAMARDGLLPRMFTRVHPRFGTPWVTIVVTGAFIGITSMFSRLDEMVDLTNIGTLFAFVVVCVGVPILRHTEPDRPRPFKVPLGPYLLPGLGAFSCLGLMWFLPSASWWRFLGWLTMGVAVYLGYGRSHSLLGQRKGRPSLAGPRLKLNSLAVAIVSVGLFVLPHDAGPSALLRALAEAHHPDHPRVLRGLGFIILGLATACLARALPARRAGRTGSG